MVKYKILKHTADLKFKTEGKTLEEAFANTALALTDTVVNVNKVKPVKIKTITITSESKESLLYDFLEKFLYLIDVSHFFINKVSKIKIKKNKNYKLTAIVKGDINRGKLGFKRHVKAITYNDMEINEKIKKVTIQVVLDL